MYMYIYHQSQKIFFKEFCFINTNDFNVLQNKQEHVTRLSELKQLQLTYLEIHQDGNVLHEIECLYEKKCKSQFILLLQ